MAARLVCMRPACRRRSGQASEFRHHSNLGAVEESNTMSAQETAAPAGTEVVALVASAGGLASLEEAGEGTCLAEAGLITLAWEAAPLTPGAAASGNCAWSTNWLMEDLSGLSAAL